MVEPQIVYLVSESQRMTIAIRGVQTRVTRDHDNFEVIQDHDSEETASREFARWLARASAEGWDLDPEHSPNPAPLDQPYAFEPMSESERLWRKATKEDEDGTLIVNLARLQARRGDNSEGSYDHPVWETVWEHLQEASPARLRITGSSRPLVEPLPTDSLPAVEYVQLGGRSARTAQDDHGELALVLDAMPALKEMVAAGIISLYKTSHANLETLSLAADPIEAATIKKLGQCKLPALRTLHIRTAWDADPDEKTLESLAGMLASPTGQSLTELRLEGGFYPEEYLGSVLSACPPQLERLILPDEFSDVEGALDLLRANEKTLANVKLELNIEAWEDDELEYLNSTFSVSEFSDEPADA